MAKFSVTDDELKELSVVKKRFGPGNYRFEIDKAEYREASTGTEGLHITFLAKHNDRDYKIFDNMWFVDSCKFRFVNILRSVSLDPTQYPIEGKEDMELLGDALAGLEGTFRVKPEAGTNYNEPAQYYTPEEAETEVLGPFPVKKAVEKTADIPF